MLRNRRCSLESLFFIVAPLLASPQVFSQERPKDKELHRAELSVGSDMEIVVNTVEAAPGSVISRHSHNGTETVYTLQGGTIQLANGEKREIATGSAMTFPRGVPHAGFTVIGDQTIKMLTVYAVDKGKPLYVEVP